MSPPFAVCPPPPCVFLSKTGTGGDAGAGDSRQGGGTFTVVLSLQLNEIYLLCIASMHNQPVTQNERFFAR